MIPTEVETDDSKSGGTLSPSSESVSSTGFPRATTLRIKGNLCSHLSSCYPSLSNLPFLMFIQILFVRSNSNPCHL